jgi:hypothetical protein
MSAWWLVPAFLSGIPVGAFILAMYWMWGDEHSSYWEQKEQSDDG